MKACVFLLLLMILTSCHVSETIVIDENGAGTIETEEVRDEYSYMKIAGENYGKEENYQDTLYKFNDIINKYNANFVRFSNNEKETLLKYKDVEVVINKNSYTKDFRTRIFQRFDKVEDVADLYKTEDYCEDLEKNYAMSPEEHYYHISYTFDGTVFNRKVKITNKENHEKKSFEIDNLKSQFSRFKINETYLLNYNFPKKIKSISNSNAKISSDRKSMKLQFVLSECLQNPEITNLEVVLENEK